MKVIPIVPGPARFEQRTILDGREYLLSFDWNSRAARWSISLADAAGAPIVSGLRVVAGMPLLRLLKDTRSPPGELLVIDREDLGDPGKKELGARCFLVYLEAVDLINGLTV
jgi:hypothetical protein